MLFSFDKDILAAALRARDKAKGDKHKQAAKERRALPQEIIENDPVWERRINRLFTWMVIGCLGAVYLMVKLGWIF